jgi:hypothetical protein
MVISPLLTGKWVITPIHPPRVVGAYQMREGAQNGFVNCQVLDHVRNLFPVLLIGTDIASGPCSLLMA